MEKHIEIWNKTTSFLASIIKYCIASISGLLNNIENNKADTEKKRDYLSELDYEDRIWEFGAMNRLLDQELILSQKIREFEYFKYSPFFYFIKTDFKDIYISKYKSEIGKNIVLFTAPIA